MKPPLVALVGLAATLLGGCVTPPLNTSENRDPIQSIFGADESEFRFLSHCYFASFPVGASQEVPQSTALVGLTDSELVLVKGNLNTARKDEVVRIPISDIDSLSIPRELHVAHDGMLTAIVLFRWGDLKIDPIKTSDLRDLLEFENVPEVESSRSDSVYAITDYPKGPDGDWGPEDFGAADGTKSIIVNPSERVPGATSQP